MHSLKIYTVLCVFSAKLGKGSVNFAFVPGLKPHTHKLYFKTLHYIVSMCYLHYDLIFRIHLDWISRGDPDDHHSVMPCAPDKVPEYSLEVSIFLHKKCCSFFRGEHVFT